MEELNSNVEKVLIIRLKISEESGKGSLYKLVAGGNSVLLRNAREHNAFLYKFVIVSKELNFHKLLVPL